jgi:Transposase DDE domain group 1
LTFRLQSFETELLTQSKNLAGLATLDRKRVARAETIDGPRRVILDMDGTEARVYGQQEQSDYNGHFESMRYHPLLLFNREGDCLAAKLRSGNVHCAEGWEEMPQTEIPRQQQQGKAVVIRADTAFAKLEIYAALEAQEVKYAIRLFANNKLKRNITELLTRPAARLSYNLWSGSRVLATSQPVERTRGGWWRRSTSTVGSCLHAWASW